MLEHLACIMDGNRRWAEEKGLDPWLGHKEGFEAVKQTIEFCLNNKITYLTLYAFSIENLGRPLQERIFLFDILAPHILEEYENELHAKNIAVRFIGDRTLWPKNVRQLCEKIEKKTAAYTALRLNFLFCYGGQQEIVDAVKRIATKVKKGDLSDEDITARVFEHFLWTSGVPATDLIIRTGGMQRLSNFFLFKSAYSELYFIDILWPNLTKKHLEDAVTFFNSCRRNFGV